MRLIEISDGISVKSDDIQALRDLKNGTTEIYLHHRKFLAEMPYATIISILNDEETISTKSSKDEAIKSTLDKLEKVLPSVGHFAG